MISLVTTIFSPYSTRGLFEFLFVLISITAVNLFVWYFIKRKFVTYGLLAISIALIISQILLLNTLFYVLLSFLSILIIIAVFVNLAEIRFLFANKSTRRPTDKFLQKKNNSIEKIFNREELYKKITKTVLYLSKYKIGAIMTFERKDNLKAFIKNGTILNAPVSFELLITIFYPGTRLHDGAVIIKDDSIVAASVYYVPSTKPMIGKYGSRHRAAIGISEICDAVTVVVSEETGRISIAYNGEIESYSPDLFEKAFINIMSESEILDNELKGNANNANK